MTRIATGKLSSERRPLRQLANQQPGHVAQQLQLSLTPKPRLWIHDAQRADRATASITGTPAYAVTRPSRTAGVRAVSGWRRASATTSGRRDAAMCRLNG